MTAGQRYTLTRLAEASAVALDVLGVGARNGQVRERPDTRTIRYYAALGLIDRPAAMSGRTALYSGRHLLQVLAVKTLQARGASLADVQRSLTGAADPELRSVIGPGLPEALAAVAGLAGGADAEADETAGAPGAASAAAPGPAERSRPGGGAFWRELPAPAPAGGRRTRSSALSSRQPGGLAGTAAGQIAPEAMQPRHMIAVPLAAGVTVMLDSSEPHAIDVTALRAAASPLLTYLTGTGLLPAPPSNPGADR